ncbi:MAG: cation-transporting P-type ATPase [Actinomycetota bacterium]|jgi:magnesium-transporting ATPase (P-type)|nr:cation-transporting P-type ATPase [Actinomycetota bacterium]
MGLAADDVATVGGSANSALAEVPPRSLTSLDAPDVLAALGSSRRGLGEDEVVVRRRSAGRNLLPPPHRRPVSAEIAAQFTSMFAVILVVAAGLTFLTYLLSIPRDPANLELTFGILAVVALNALVGFTQEHSAERTAEALQTMLPRTTRVLRAGVLVELGAEELVPGDMVVLRAGDAVPADGRVVEAHELSVEMAALTGESQPASRTDQPVEAGTAPLDARNCVFMGTSVVRGTARVVVFATGVATELGRVYRLTAEQAPEPSPLQRQVADMARRVAAVAIVVGALLFAVRLFTGNAAVASFVFALAVMVALVPEGLPATLSVSLAVAVRRMATHHALVKRLAAVESLGSTTVICTDKTGTLTKAEMTVQEVFASGRVHHVTGVGYEPVGEVEDAAAVTDVLVAGALCSDARIIPSDGDEDARVLGDTTEGAVVVAAAKAGIDVDVEAARTPRVGVFPFDPDRKLMTTVHRSASGTVAYVKGSPQAVLDRCVVTRWDGREVPLDSELRRRIDQANDTMAARGLRVLAVAGRALPGTGLILPDARAISATSADGLPTPATGIDGLPTPAGRPVTSADRQPTQADVESGLAFYGLVGMSDPPRPEVTAAVAACRRAGIAVVMVTGDYGLTAEAVARRVGIIGTGPARVVTGAELDAMDDSMLASALAGDEQVIFARVRPEHKMRIVASLESRGEVVAVTGDGVNDAPALKRASIGVAMGRGGTDVARAAAVMVLLDDSFASITTAVELGRAVYQNLRHLLAYIFSHNLAELAPILAAVFVGFPLVPLNALQVLSIDLGSDVLPGMALGTEKPELGTMDHPPRPTTEHLFSWAVVRRFLFLGSIQSAGVVFAFFWRIHTAHLPYSAFTAANPTYREALTMTQVGIIVSQFFNRFAVRSDRESVLRIGLLSNRPLFLVGFVDVGFAVAVSYVPALQSVFHTAALRLSDWLVLVGFGALLLVADEARKAWHRRMEPSRLEPDPSGRNRLEPDPSGHNRLEPDPSPSGACTPVEASKPGTIAGSGEA